MRYFKRDQMLFLILGIVLVNSFGLFFPLIRNDDPTLYASIAKNMLISHNWLYLTYHGNPWLDKPHFPFWITALSFSILGINSFAYLIPGFLFSLIGGFYTYKLAKELYNQDIALLSLIIYLSSLHILLSSIDVRAEAYLLGTIMPACYYWYMYNNKSSYSNLFLGALFTACAIMTKGIFVIITITSGLVTLWIYTGQYRNLIKPKWLIAIILSLFLILPELVSLYLQFDRHPELVVFNHTHVSGIKWFFWGSQFGRFFDNGPIIQTGNTSFLHYFFFIHTFMWSFLPWSVVFVFALINWFKHVRAIAGQVDRVRFYYLLGSILPTFIVFSLSKFQLDYYINILLPFAAIICARWFFEHRSTYSGMTHKLFYFQIYFAVILILMIMLLSVFVFGVQHIWLISIAGIIILVTFILFIHQDDLAKSILYPVMAMSLLFIFLMLINGRLCAKYDAGYQASLYLNKRTLPVFDYNNYSLSLDFHSQNNYTAISDDLSQLKAIKKPYYLFVKDKDSNKIKAYLGDGQVTVVDRINGTSIDVVFRYLLSRNLLEESLSHYLILKVLPVANLKFDKKLKE